MFTEQQEIKIKGDRPIEPENDEEQKWEAGPRVKMVRRLIERDRPGAGTVTLADYVAAGYDNLGSIAAAFRRGKEAGAQFQHGLITYDVPVSAVLHVTDDSLGNTVPLGRSDWFSVSAAENYARSASAAAPAPQRYLVYGENEALVSIWQSGQEMSMFVVAAKRAREADVTGEQWLDGQGIVGPERSQFVEYIRFNQWENEVCTEARWEKEYYGFIESKRARARQRASMSARARRMAAAAHRAKRPVAEGAVQMGSDKWSYSTKEELAERIGMFQATEMFFSGGKMETEDLEGSPVWVYFETGNSGNVIVEMAEGKRPTKAAYYADITWREVEPNNWEATLQHLTTKLWFVSTNQWAYAIYDSPGHRAAHGAHFGSLEDAKRSIEADMVTMLVEPEERFEGKRPVTEGARGPVEGEVVWLSSSGQEMTIEEIDWPKEVVVLAGAGGQKVVPVASLRYFGSSGIDWMCDAEGSGTETEEGVRSYRIMAGDRELMVTPARSVEQATDIAEETLAKGNRAAYIAWQDEGRVEAAGDPTLKEAFAWAGPLAAGAATGRVDAVQTDPGLLALIETLGQEVGESEG